MAPRANWKGYLRLSLVSCPVALFPASSLSEKIHFHRINKQTGNRLKQQNVDSVTGEVVERDNTGRGYEVAKGQYLEVHDEEIDAIHVESTRTIDIDEFVPRAEIDDRFMNAPYYIAPDGKVGEEAFAVIRDTIAKMGMVALGRVVLTRREHVIALEARGKGLLATTLRYPYEIRDDAAFFEDIPDVTLPKEMFELAAHIVETKRGHFDASKFRDHYEEKLVELIKAKQAGRSLEQQPEAPAPNVINLMDALKRSIAAERPSDAAAEKPAAAAPKPKTKKASKPVAGQREMLLPIEGKGGKEAGKSERRPAPRTRKAG